jgi:hypothetical protein
VRGRIRDRAGLPVPGADVLALRGPPPVDAEVRQELLGDPLVAFAAGVSDASGSFEIPGLPEGPAYLWVRAPRRLRDGMLAMVSAAIEAEAIVGPLDPGSELPPIVLSHDASAGSTVVVEATDAGSGDPVLDGLNGLLRDERGTPVAFGLVAGPGRMLFGPVPPGRYRVQVDAAPHRAAERAVELGCAPAIVEVALARGAVLRARLDLSALQGREEHLVVEAEREAARARIVRGRVREGGCVEFAGLEPGTWALRARATDGEGRVLALAGARALVDGSERSGDPAEGPRLHLVPSATLDLRLAGFAALPHDAPPCAHDPRARLRIALRRAVELDAVVSDSAGTVLLHVSLAERRARIEGADLRLPVPVPAGGGRLRIERAGRPVSESHVTPGTPIVLDLP